MYAAGSFNTRGSIKRYALRDELEFGDSCAIIAENDQELVDCRQFADGVLTRGVHSALELFVRVARSLKDELNREPVLTVEVANSTLHSPKALILQGLGTNWLARGLELATLQYNTELLILNEKFQEVRAISVGVFFAVLLMLLLCLYEPLVRSLDQEFKKVRSILIMVPLAWLDEVKELAELVKAQA